MKIRLLCTMVLLMASAVFLFGAGQQGAGVQEEIDPSSVTIKILKGNRNFDPNDNPVKDTIEELTGFNTEWHMLPPGQQANERIMLELSSGTDFDLILIGNKSVFFDVAGKGALLALDDLLKQYGPNVLESSSENLWTEMTVNGKICGIPVKRNPKSTLASVSYRKDVFDELGISDPVTLEDFTNAMVTIKEKTDMMPFTCESANIVNVQPVAAAFGLSTYWKEIDGELVPKPLQPAMKEYLAYWNAQYEAGLIDEEIPANKRENEQKRFASGEAAIIPTGWGEWQTLVAMQESVGGEVAVMKALQGPDGIREMEMERVLSDYPMVMPRDAKQPEATMMFVNEFVDKDNFARLVGGEKGVHYKEENGELMPINPAFNDEIRMIWWYLVATRENDYPKYFELGPKSNQPIVYWMYNELQQNMQYAVMDPTTFVLPRPDSEGKYKNSLAQLENEYYTKIIFGGESLDNYDKFIELWLSEGGQEMIDDMNAAYQAKK